MHRSYILIPFVLLMGGLNLLGCESSVGEITTKIHTDSSLIKSKQPLYGTKGLDPGVFRFVLGEDEVQQRYYGDFHTIHLASSDGALVIFRKRDASLYLWQRDDRSVFQIEHKELKGRVTPGVLSPDRKHVAFSRQADYRLPDEERPESVDDSVYILDIDTRQWKVFRGSSKGFEISGMRWTEPEALTYYAEVATTTHHDRMYTQLDLITGEHSDFGREAFLQLPHTSYRAKPEECHGMHLIQDDQGIEIKKGSQRKRVVHVEGRTRAMHDNRDTFSTLFFMPGCNEVVLSHGKNLYVYQVKEDRLVLNNAPEFLANSEYVSLWYFPDE